MTQRNMNRTMYGIAAGISITTMLVMLAGYTSAQIQLPPGAADDAADKSKAAEKTEKEKAALQVGTYDPQEVFRAHPAQDKLIDSIRSAQKEMQEAQEAGDQEKMQQIQQRAERNREQVIDRFQQDVADALPKVARSAKVKVVALEVVYAAEDVRTKNITPQLIDVFRDENKDADRVPSLLR